MKKPVSVFSTPSPWDAVADGYARTTMNVLTKYAAEAVRAVPIPKKARVLDVACGPGTLSFLLAKKADQIEAIDFSKDMLAQFKIQIRRRKLKNIRARFGDGQKLPYKSGSFDAGFSSFGLMFFPNRKKGFAELHRTLKPGGWAAVTSWAPIERSPVMKLMFEAVRVMAPELAVSRRVMHTLEEPRVFRQEMERAGFRRVKIRPVIKSYPVGSARKFWAFMVEGSAPMALIRKKLGPALWREKEKLALARLRRIFRARRQKMTSQAWLGTGQKPLFAR